MTLAGKRGRRCPYCRERDKAFRRGHCGHAGFRAAFSAQRKALFAARTARGQTRKTMGLSGRRPPAKLVAAFVAHHCGRVAWQDQVLRAAGLDPATCSAEQAERAFNERIDMERRDG